MCYNQGQELNSLKNLKIGMHLCPIKLTNMLLENKYYIKIKPINLKTIYIYIYKI